MISASGDRQNQSPTTAVKGQTSLDERLQRLIELSEQNAPAEVIKEAEEQFVQAAKQQPFEIRKQLPFFQQLVRKFDATNAFQHFRLPGRARVVEDRRDKPKGEPKEADKSAPKESKDARQDMRLKDGRLVDRKERTYTNYLGDRSQGPASLDRQAAGERVERMLSAFERMVVERFEEGRQIASESADGKPKFLAKTEGQWRDFFKSFAGRAVPKKALISEIREFLMRGVVPKGEKGIVISDMKMMNGRVEKFVRFSILAEAMAKLKSLSPGEAFGKGMLGEMSGEELVFLALAVSRGREVQSSMMPAQGKFIGGKAEAEAARALGVQIDEHLRQKARTLRGRKGGAFGGMFDEEGAPDETPYQFIPWWRWGNLQRPGKFRWVTAVFYGSLLILAIIGIAALSYRLLSGY